MIKSAASKVMWVGRATVFLVGLAVILALVFGITSTAFAHKGNKGFFHLGHKNVSKAVSTLVKQGPGPALSLMVKAGQPPLKVNSSGKVANLNSDQLDNLDSSAFMKAGQKAADSDKLDGKNSTDFYAAGSKVADSSHADQADNATNANNAANADKLDGKDSNDLAVKTAFTSGRGLNPTGTLQFLVTPATVSVNAGQAVHVTSNKAFGSTVAGGASSLNLLICHRPQGSTATPTPFGSGIFDNRVPQNTRVTMGLSAVITGLPAGNHQVGLCGKTEDGNTNWNSNEWGSTSAMVVTRPSGGTASASSTTSVEKR